MKQPIVRPYRGVPAEERRVLRRRALLDASLDLLGTEGWANATVRGVSTRAGLNDRYFYESFPDLDALLLAVVDEQAGLGTEVILAAAAAAPRQLRPRSRAVVTAILDFLAEDPRRARILSHEFPSNVLLQDRKRAILGSLTAIFTTQLYDVLDGVPLSAEDVHLTALTVNAGLWEVVTLWLRGDLATTRAHLIDYTVAFLSLTTALPDVLEEHLD
ncbi:MAG: TetR/AcrR family transcriptional regulator [Streptosporangiaceae bacterium]